MPISKQAVLCLRVCVWVDISLASINSGPKHAKHIRQLKLALHDVLYADGEQQDADRGLGRLWQVAGGDSGPKHAKHRCMVQSLLQLLCCRLMVGSGMATGEWTGSGKWQEVTEAAMDIPSSLQQIESNDLTKTKELGRGQFGSVWLCRLVVNLRYATQQVARSSSLILYLVCGGFTASIDEIILEQHSQW